MDAVTLIIPTLPERSRLLARAYSSAQAQTYPFTRTIIEPAGPDDDAAATRQRALEKVVTPWVAFLDDDDELERAHLKSLIKAQRKSGADVVYSWFTPYENGKPTAERIGMLQLNGKTALGLPWSQLHENELKAGRWCFHLTALFRTKLLHEIGGFNAPGRGVAQQYLSEDVDLEQRLVTVGAAVHHCPRKTWRWHFWDGRTKGQPAHLR